MEVQELNASELSVLVLGFGGVIHGLGWPWAWVTAASCLAPGTVLPCWLGLAFFFHWFDSMLRRHINGSKVIAPF